MIERDIMKLRNPEGSEAADEIERLRAERDEAQAEANAGRQAEHDADRERDEAIAERDRLREALRQAGSWRGIAEGKDIVIRQLEAERDRLRSGLLRAIQYENKCDETGKSCDESRACPCACSLEAETWCRT